MCHQLHSITFLTPGQWATLQGSEDTYRHVFSPQDYATLRIAVCNCGWEFAAWHGPILVRESQAHVRSSVAA
jgi:hypothetical protein